MQCVIRTKHRDDLTAAFNRLEFLVVIVSVFVVVVLSLVPGGVTRARQKSERIDCVNNLKEIGTASRVWENDNGNRFPVASNCWSYYSSLTLGRTPNVLVCPADERKPATINEVLTDNSHLSYFVGVGVADTEPQSILGGDRNLAPGAIPQADYGFSLADGKGNDVTISGPVCWSLKMHSHGNTSSAGNILLGDGSAQQCSSANLRQSWLYNATNSTTNALHLIFP